MQPADQSTTKVISITESPWTIRQEKLKVLPIKKLNKKGRLKRLSPFLLLAFFLPLQFAYYFLTGKYNGENLWGQLFMLIFLEINILFIDFAIWNYNQYKKVAIIWLIESLISAAIIYFMSR